MATGTLVALVFRRKVLRRLAPWLVLVVLLSVLVGIALGNWMGRPPQSPIEELGLDIPVVTDDGGDSGTSDDATGSGPPAAEGVDTPTDPARPPTDPATASGETGAGDATPDTEDPEQQAFAERRAADGGDEISRPLDFTDFALVHQLTGTWRLDLGGSRRRHRVTFGDEVVRRVHRERFELALFPVDGAGRLPYFTIVRVPGREPFLAFLDTGGRYRLLLQDLRLDDGVLSWRGADDERKQGRREGDPGPI